MEYIIRWCPSSDCWTIKYIQDNCYRIWHQGTGHFWAASNKHLNISCDSELAKTGGDVTQCFDTVLEIFASCSSFLRM